MIHARILNFSTKSPPSPYTRWHKPSTRKRLKMNGFDLKRLIFRCDDPRIDGVIFKQDNSKWCEYDKLAEDRKKSK